jgi:hypothetical protein
MQRGLRHPVARTVHTAYTLIYRGDSCTDLQLRCRPASELQGCNKSSDDNTIPETTRATQQPVADSTTVALRDHSFIT